MEGVKVKYKRACILLSGGVGTRYGSEIPKQYISIDGKTIIEHTMCAVRGWTEMDALLIVAADEWQADLTAIVNKVYVEGKTAFLGFATPGASRQLSVVNGMKAIKPYMAEDAVAMIHDAVRPCVSNELLKRCSDAIGQGEGVMPYLALKDTIYESEDGIHIRKALDRDKLYAGQTPEFFDYWKYLNANDALSEEEMLKVRGSAEPAVMAGMNIVMVPGEEANYKITTREDMEHFRQTWERGRQSLEAKTRTD